MIPRARWTVTALLLLAVTGCASVKKLVTSPEDISVQQKRRAAENLQIFETRRDFAQFQAAQARWREGNTAACREALEALLGRNPKHFEARVLMAELLLSEEEFESARNHLELAIAERSGDARSQHMMGLLMEAMGQESEALAFYQRAAELEPKNEQYASSCRGSAEDFPEQLASYDSGTPKAEGPASAPLGHESPDARSAGQGVEEQFAEAARAFVAGDAAAARSLLTRLITSEPDNPHLLIRAAVMALRHEQPDTAVFLLQPTAGRFSDTAALQRTLGTAYYRMGDYRSAERALKQALSLDNSNALAYLLMGCTLEKLGQAGAAKGHFEEARRLDPRL
jgi:predicted Zn-dependent protease